MLSTEPDKRYRVLVLLQRSDRPRYYTFYCFRCQMAVCELVNSDVAAAQDVLDYTNLGMQATSVTCNGRFQGGHCRMHYVFSLSDNAVKRPRTVVTRTVSATIKL